jgi:hypothetical protein
MIRFKEEPKVRGGQRLRAQLRLRLALLHAAVLLFMSFIAAANSNPEWGTIRRKATLAASGFLLRSIHRLSFIGEV